MRKLQRFEIPSSSHLTSGRILDKSIENRLLKWTSVETAPLTLASERGRVCCRGRDKVWGDDTVERKKE